MSGQGYVDLEAKRSCSSHRIPSLAQEGPWRGDDGSVPSFPSRGYSSRVLHT
jgi:hypothetical protein